jgi:hypothetical protein
MFICLSHFWFASTLSVVPRCISFCQIWCLFSLDVGDKIWVMMYVRWLQVCCEHNCYGNTIRSTILPFLFVFATIAKHYDAMKQFSFFSLSFETKTFVWVKTKASFGTWQKRRNFLGFNFYIKFSYESLHQGLNPIDFFKISMEWHLL